MPVTLRPATATVEFSTDGTVKFGHLLADGQQVEACVLNLSYRAPTRVICISSQVGCPFTCDFCRSGHGDFLRNLSAVEIVDQVVAAIKLLPDCVGHPFDVTYMGIGEPLANFAAVHESFGVLIDRYKNLHCINVSTIGPEGMIKRLESTRLKKRLHLQLSLHSPFDKERARLFRQELPSAAESIHALSEFGHATGDRPCVNYLLIGGLNDSSRHSKALAQLLPKDNSCYVKVSAFNPIEQSSLGPASDARLSAFAEELRCVGLDVKTFRSRGQDVHAGCGQFVAEMAST